MYRLRWKMVWETQVDSWNLNNWEHDRSFIQLTFFFSFKNIMLLSRDDLENSVNCKIIPVASPCKTQPLFLSSLGVLFWFIWFLFALFSFYIILHFPFIISRFPLIFMFSEYNVMTPSQSNMTMYNLWNYFPQQILLLKV